MTSLRSLLPLFALAAAACNQASSAEPPRGHEAPTADAVAVVNGVSINDREVRLRARAGDGHKDAAKGDPAAHHLDAVLETVISEEMAAQRAAELGLDADPRYRDGLAQMEAQLAAYRRKALSELFWERAVDRKAAPSEAEARAYFDLHQKQIRTQIHVKQILRKGKKAIDEARRQIEGGTPFEDVARSQLPNLPPGVTPWDLGYLSWYKVPEAWRGVVYDLAPGAMSPVIAGPNERYWLVVVVDQKEDPSADFESARGPIVNDLTRQRVDAARDKAASELKARARVEHLRAPTPEPPHPTED
jgi:peptidyl-prolyl cis-trans isomerase C